MDMKDFGMKNAHDLWMRFLVFNFDGPIGTNFPYVIIWNFLYSMFYEFKEVKSWEVDA